MAVAERSPKVSVLVPTFRRPQLLREALASVAAQSVRDIEILVSDDGDEGLAVVESLGDPRIEYVRNEPSLGTGRNYNALLDRGRGELLAPINDDDRYLPGFLAACLQAFERMPDLGLVFSNHLNDRAGRLTVRRCGLRPGRHENWAADFMSHNPVAFSASVLRRDAWRAVRPLPAIRTADQVLFARIVAGGWPAFYIDEPLVVYRLHAAGVSAALSTRMDVVHASESYSFRSQQAERLRLDRLAEELLDRAAMFIRQQRLDLARADLARAEWLITGPSLRLRLLRALAARPILARAATSLDRRLRG